MREYKKCKSVNSKTAGYGCGTMVKAQTRKYGLCQSCFRRWLLETDEGEAHINKTSLKVSKERRKMEEASKEFKRSEDLKTLQNNVKNEVHRAVKIRDKGKPCISCDRPWSPSFQAGHFLKSELYSNVRYNFENIHGQCQRCNMFLDGNVIEYEKRLIGRIGKENVEKLKSLASLVPYRYTIDEMKEIRENAKNLRKIFS